MIGMRPFKSLTRTRRINMSGEDVKRIIHRHGAQQWFVYIFESRHKRWDVWKPGFWLDDHLPRDARILETGCGCGMNLIWLGQRGFTELSGYDCDPTAIAAGEDLVREAGLSMSLWVDDGLAPRRMPDEPFDAIIALNWTSLVNGFDLNTFLRHCRENLNRDGVVILDAIDARYNEMPNNEYQAADWKKPVAERRPSEYKNRYSSAQIVESADAAGLRLEKTITAKEIIPKNVCILRRTK